MGWAAGFGKTEITAWEPELAMMGWGRMDNRTVGVHSPLFARAAALSNGESTIFYVSIELMAVSNSIRLEVLRRLAECPEVTPHSLMITATHTHSGPSGYSHHFFMNMNGPGFSPVVWEAAVSGAVASVKQALSRLQPVTLELGHADMPLDQPVAFNRSWYAYNLNEDVDPVTEETRDQATDRRMTVLSARAGDALVGCISWFPVHCTSVHSENELLHSDNKGIAATQLEAEYGDDFVAVFAQDASGDVTPNYRYNRRRKKVVGHCESDYESAEFNGTEQRRLAQRIMGASKTLKDGVVWGATHHRDFSAIEVSARHARGQTERTKPAVLGLSMAEGTAEGPGPILGVRGFNRWLTRRKARAQQTDDPKIPMLDVGHGIEGKFLGRFALKGLKVPAFDPTIGYVKRLMQQGTMGAEPWIAQTVPLQLMQIGPVLIIGLPFEATTVAGRRIRALALQAFASRGIEHVIIGSYTNEYSGYCTTFEEYQLQHYEAGYTLFGPHQLGAVLTVLEWMVDRVDDMPLGEQAPEFELAEVMERSFQKPWPGKRAKPAW